ncbi:membrane protein insertion efficiency factor YidD [Nodularia sp. UHCC 0506]|uniref:membrane protein insertion efficiency factor YidD n=1 Tax=Nodularia sp. UHCC 0506 TaxID=3110243 RepID=UPI002B21DFD2|nr:membrane protein insertion efficiency factor YidD [Nodularia sp. UHCC 0506]MEA5514999.1 membrane protein insertion efficiency factor YidD [Nodularia sp. UHCC 0506]
MQISAFNSLTRQVGVIAITGYQKHISPHKGFACAHRMLYGGESCSQYFKQVIIQDGFRAALTQSRERFQACKQANYILRTQAEKREPEPQKPQSPQHKPGSNNRDCNDYLTGIECGGHCVEILITSPDCSGADCTSPDCSALDCSGADCSFLDCGSCS